MPHNSYQDYSQGVDDMGRHFQEIFHPPSKLKKKIILENPTEP